MIVVYFVVGSELGGTVWQRVLYTRGLAPARSRRRVALSADASGCGAGQKGATPHPLSWKSFD
jgi:hypothetical protein